MFIPIQWVGVIKKGRGKMTATRFLSPVFETVYGGPF
jgi:hypothetical protein